MSTGLILCLAALGLRHEAPPGEHDGGSAAGVEHAEGGPRLCAERPLGLKVYRSGHSAVTSAPRARAM